MAFFSTLLHRRCPIAKARTVDQKDQLFWNETTTHKRCGATTQDAADSPILTGCGALVFLPKCDAMKYRSDVSEHLVDRQTSFLDETQTLFMNKCACPRGRRENEKRNDECANPSGSLPTNYAGAAHAVLPPKELFLFLSLAARGADLSFRNQDSVVSHVAAWVFFFSPSFSEILIGEYASK